MLFGAGMSRTSARVVKASTLKINLQPTRLHACLQKVLEQKQAELTEKSLHLDLGLDLPDREVWADPDRLIQVLWHLLDNAIKFTPQGQICIYTEVINLSAQEVNTPVSLITEGQRRSPQNPQNFQILPDGDDLMQRSLWVRLTLCDTGIGFDPQQVHKLFQSFFMADGSMTRKNGGTGIGLALCQTLMYRMGGRICLSSPGKNQGCTAFIELPLVFPNVYPSI